MKEPRHGTRVRAVYDVLSDGCEHRWSELKSVYEYACHPYSNPNYAGMNLSRILRKYANRVRRGVYVGKQFSTKQVQESFEIAQKADQVVSLGLRRPLMDKKSEELLIMLQTPYAAMALLLCERSRASEEDKRSLVRLAELYQESEDIALRASENLIEVRKEFRGLLNKVVEAK